MNQAEISAKRDAVYASLLKYASEAVPLRERAIDRMVLAALIGTTESTPLKATEVRANMPLGSTGERIRLEVVQESLRRLEGVRKVDERLVREKKKYFLADDGYAELDKVLASSNDLFESAFQVVFKDFDVAGVAGEVREVFRRFVCKVFELLGRDIAASLTGHAGQEVLLGRVECEVSIKYALGNIPIPPERVESVRARCRQFLSSQDSDAVQLKYYLTQGFYLAQLFLVDADSFTPLASEAFKGAVFYLDTNVLLVGLLHREGTEGVFAEFLEVARRAGAELKVTRETIDEIRTVIAARRDELIKIMDGVPVALAERTKDRIHRAFFEERDRNPRITPEEFFDRIQDVTEIIQRQWGIRIEDVTAEEILRGKNVDDLLKLIDRHAVHGRGWGKSDAVLRHDAAHYVLVQDDRRGNPKTWFLTRDRTMIAAAGELCRGGLPVTFDFVAFVSSLSPFVMTAKDSTVVSSVLSWVLADQTKAVDGLFESRELVLMGEMHADVMATPPDQLVLAFDYAKSAVLHGRQYSRQDTPEMSLALRKFLASSALERDRAAQMERNRLAMEIEEQTDKWEVEERLRRQAFAERDDARDEAARIAKENMNISGEFQLERRRAVTAETAKRRQESLLCVVAAEGGLAGATYPDSVVAFASRILGIPATGSARIAATVLGGTLFLVCAIGALRMSRWRDDQKNAWLVGACILLVGLAGAPDALTTGGAADWATLLLLAALGGGGLLWHRNRRSLRSGTFPIVSEEEAAAP